jgi:signal transduction histidine kinase
MCAFDVLLMEQLPGGAFVACGGVPRWCEQVRPTARWDVPFSVVELFPFIDVFLPEAERAWAGPKASPTVSDFWTESGVAGEDLHLFAAAVAVGPARALVVIRSDRLFLDHQHVVQHARELHLTHGTLMRELERKDILVHAIIHDLAAPLHSILGMLSLLEEEPHPEQEQRWIRYGIQAAKRQRDLIEEILDVFAAEGGALRGETTAVDLAAVLEHVAAEWAPVARMRNLTLDILPLPEGTSGLVEADEMRLVRVLTNLVDNAFRMSPAGGKVCVVTRNEGATVMIAVEDEGPGVQSELVPRLFEKFARGRGASGGTGLGLFFSRISVENWGGGIGYEQRESGGARFWIRLNTVRGRELAAVPPPTERSHHGEPAHAR